MQQLVARPHASGKNREDKYVLVEDVNGVGFYRLQNLEMAENLYRTLGDSIRQLKQGTGA